MEAVPSLPAQATGPARPPLGESGLGSSSCTHSHSSPGSSAAWTPLARSESWLPSSAKLTPTARRKARRDLLRLCPDLGITDALSQRSECRTGAFADDADGLRELVVRRYGLSTPLVRGAVAARSITTEPSVRRCSANSLHASSDELTAPPILDNPIVLRPHRSPACHTILYGCKALTGDHH